MVRIKSFTIWVHHKWNILSSAINVYYFYAQMFTSISVKVNYCWHILSTGEDSNIGASQKFVHCCILASSFSLCRHTHKTLSSTRDVSQSEVWFHMNSAEEKTSYSHVLWRPVQEDLNFAWAFFPFGQHLHTGKNTRSVIAKCDVKNLRRPTHFCRSSGVFAFCAAVVTNN